MNAVHIMVVIIDLREREYTDTLPAVQNSWEATPLILLLL